MMETNKNKPVYSLCESVTGIGPWHIRQLTAKGKKLTGGIDTPSLCGIVHPFGTKMPGGERNGSGGWDLDVPLHVESEHVCRPCRAVLQVLSEMPDRPMRHFWSAHEGRVRIVAAFECSENKRAWFVPALGITMWFEQDLFGTRAGAVASAEQWLKKQIQRCEALLQEL